nr:hypothetical protein [Tanacetum cinerariifolium]
DTVKRSVDIHRGDLLWSLRFLDRSCTREEKEIMGFDLTKSYLCPGFVESHTAKGVDLR